MELNERQKQILDITEKMGRVTVNYLSKNLYVTEMTIRRDLKVMDREGLLKRYHGGALAIQDSAEYPIELRMHIHEKEKRDLAINADKYISDGQTIFLCSSSTCAYIIPYLKNYKDIAVVTNSVQFLPALAKLHVRCFLAGGEYWESEHCLVGRNTENYLRGINTDIAFLSCDGISADGMVTVSDAATAEIMKIAFQNAARKIILADHSKLGAKYTYNICAKDEADEIIII